ncbi:hypothetical protein ISN45_At02g036340 [Arabidopsis thaliana x Arabidopsis arenosa]|uniref:Uncharacterized protein n=1 Tax=Arabidopsis thaliana x Arabidopsis arenosa TaxID=1240361 RepID=A0A8T2FSP4_9BRAS|nr:hypothetical protein ISN45_At02g036340 [Arabidopsis thaliana x Arabidopsis arenosa]
MSFTCASTKKVNKIYIRKDRRNVCDWSGDGAIGGSSSRSAAASAAADDIDGNSGGADANAYLLSHLLSTSSSSFSLFIFL